MLNIFSIFPPPPPCPPPPSLSLSLSLCFSLSQYTKGFLVRNRIRKTKAKETIIAFYRRYKLRAFIQSIVEMFRYLSLSNSFISIVLFTPSTLQLLHSSLLPCYGWIINPHKLLMWQELHVFILNYTCTCIITSIWHVHVLLHLYNMYMYYMTCTCTIACTSMYVFFHLYNMYHLAAYFLSHCGCLFSKPLWLLIF